MAEQPSSCGAQLKKELQTHTYTPKKILISVDVVRQTQST